MGETKTETAERLETIAGELTTTAAEILAAYGHGSRWATTLERCARELHHIAEFLPTWEALSSRR